MSDSSTNPPLAEDRQRLQQAWDDALAMQDGQTFSGGRHRRQSFTQEWKAQQPEASADRRQQVPPADECSRPTR
ncbi:hypothetical protein AB1L30_14175 [Bremerella sp. JC817]|uniref:hypothetical protein n=1 Tax=Bremerella sp. JC817 TaxID=3231756 RepID=UPI00345ADD80